MKKNLFVMAALAVLAIGCAKEQQPDVQNPADVNAKKTYLRVSVEDTKVAVNPLDGACSWQEGDVLAVWFVTEQETVIDDKGNETQKDVSGVRVEFTYESDNEDGSAKFATTENIPEFIYAKAAYPATSLTSTGGFTLTRDYTYNPDSVPVYVRDFSVTKNEDGTLSSNLVHNASVMKFTLRDIPAYAAGFVLESTTSTQTIKITTSFPYKTGYDQDITLHSVVAQGSVPTKFYLIDGENAAIEGTEKNFKEATPVNTKSYIDMGTVDFQKANLRKDYVKVCGVKWAKGNLQYEKDNGDSSFQDGWKLAPSQWAIFNYDIRESSTSKATSKSDSNEKFEHFNLGGIARNARFSTYGNYLTPTSQTLEISGKIYSDIEAENEVTDDSRFKAIPFETNSNIYGDVAFWASKGAFRLPKSEEMIILHNVASKQPGYYKTDDGYYVFGILCYTPYNERYYTTNFIELDEADLELGVFLPYAGRRYRASKTANITGDINAITTQGTYRTGTYYGTMTDNNPNADNASAVQPNYVSEYYHIDKLYGKSGSTPNAAYSNSAGFCIRPVLVEE